MKSQSNPFFRPARFAAALTLALTAIQAHAAPLYWDGTDTTANADGGSGTWDTITTNWDTAASAGSDSAWGTAANTNIANFGGTGGTVTLGADLGAASGAYPNAINVTAGNYVIDQAAGDLGFRGTGINVNGGATLEIKNGTITLQNTGATTVSGTNALTISSQIIASTTNPGTGVSKVGGGDLTLTNANNDFTGDLLGQNAGNLYISSIKNAGVASAAGAGSTVQNGVNNALVYTGPGDSTDRTFSIFGAGNDTLKNNGTTGALTWTGPFTNTKTGSSTLTLGGTNTAANDFQGALVNNGANILSVTKDEAGTWKLSGVNTYTGTTTIAAGILQANQADVPAVSGALGNGGTIRFTGGTLQYSATSAGTDYSTRIISNTTAAIKLDTNGQNVTFGTPLASSNTAGLTKEGAGQLELRMSVGFPIPVPQYSGTTTINGGTLKFAGAVDLDGISSSSININNGASLVIYSDFNRTTLSNGKTFTFGNTGGGSVVYDKGNHLWQSSTGKFVTTGGAQNTISAANGGFINTQGANTVNFDVADGTDAVDLLVSVAIGSGSYTKSGAGTLSITSFSSLGGGAAQPNLTINAGTFDVGGPARLTTVGQSTGVVTSDILNNGVYQHSSSNPQTLSGIMSGSGALTQNGAGTLTVTNNANSYSGDTTVTKGTLSLGNGTTNTSLANGSDIVIGTDATAVLNLNYSGTDTVATLSINGVSKAPGIYGSSDPSGRITGTGTLTVTSGGSPYTTWANTFLPGNDVSNPAGDNDNDGLVNQQEFAFGLSPISGSSVNPILVSLNKTTGTFTYQRRAATGLTYKILTSTDLVGWPEDTTATAGQVAGAVDGNGNQTVVVTLTGTKPLTATKLFVRVAAQ